MKFILIDFVLRSPIKPIKRKHDLLTFILIWKWMGDRSPDPWRKQDNLKTKLKYCMGRGLVQNRENTKESAEKLWPTRSGWVWRNQTKMEESKKAKEENVIKTCKVKTKKLNIKADNGDTSWFRVIEFR